MQAATQLRSENTLKNDALARTRNEKAAALEALFHKQKEAERARRVEKRLEGLYGAAVGALENEQESAQELTSSCLRLHRAILKVFTTLEDYMKRLKLDIDDESREENGEAPTGDAENLPGHVKDRAALMSWDEKMLKQVYQWLNIRLSNYSKAPMAGTEVCGFKMSKPASQSFQLHTPGLDATGSNLSRPLRTGRPPSPSSTNPYTPLPALRHSATPKLGQSRGLKPQHLGLEDGEALALLPVAITPDSLRPHSPPQLSPWKDDTHL